MHIGHLQMVPNVIATALGDFASQRIVFLEEFQHLLDLLRGGIFAQWYIMDPRLQRIVEKFPPLVAHMEHQRIAQEQVLKSKAGRNAAIIEQIFVLAVLLQGDLFGWLGAQRVFRRFPRLVFRVPGIDQLGLVPGQKNDAVAFGGGARAAEKAQRLFLLPRPLFRRVIDRIAVLVPAAQPGRVQRNGRAALPETPGRIEYVVVVVGATERKHRSHCAL